MMMTQFLYKLWGYSRVEKDKDTTVIEADFSYRESFVRQGVFLLLFGSSLLALFLSGLSVYLFYYGAAVLGLMIFLLGFLQFISLPEFYLARLLGHDVVSDIDTSKPGRYRATYTITKKSKGLFKSNYHMSGINSKGSQYSYDIDPAGRVAEKSDGAGLPYMKSLFGITNFLVTAKPVFLLAGSLLVLLFSFVPIVNIFLILSMSLSLIQYFSVQWKDTGLAGKTLIATSILALILSILAAIASYLIIFMVIYAH